MLRADQISSRSTPATADQIEQGRLAAAGRTEKRDEFPLAHIERYLFERQHRPPARRPVDMFDAFDDDL
jgi:hypothetical protein